MYAHSAHRPGGKVWIRALDPCPQALPALVDLAMTTDDKLAGGQL